MNLVKKIIVVSLALFSLHSFADELSVDLQKVCVQDQISAHKGIKGHIPEASAFEEYSKCETDFVLEKATKDQVNQISKNQNTNAVWLKQLKTKATKSCLDRRDQITT